MRGHVLPFMLCREHDQELLLKRRQLSGKGKGFELTNREQELGKLIGTDAESTLFRGVPKVGLSVSTLCQIFFLFFSPATP